MNKYKVLQLAAHLESIPPHQFDIDSYDCGTSACIAGWANRLWGRQPLMDQDQSARLHLGLDGHRAQILFYERMWLDNKPTNLEAARTLRRLAETEIVQWD